MKTNKILFPTDFSHTGDAALELATVLAKDADATLLIVHVEEPPVAYGGGEMYYGLPEPAHDEIKRMLQEVKPTRDDVKFEHRLVTGDPPSAVVRLAEEENVDLVVMGTHGRTGLSRLLMGSVAEAIVRRAKCPVLTYKHTAKEAEKASEK